MSERKFITIEVDSDRSNVTTGGLKAYEIIGLLEVTLMKVKLDLDFVGPKTDANETPSGSDQC